MEIESNSILNGGKVSGYLEMKSRLNFWRRWRKYWFVLDGKMLLYYKTKEKCENLGRCKGFLNMSLAQAVQPCSISRSYPLEIITRTKTVQLSACDEENRQKWLNALLNSLRLPEVSAPILERLSSRLSAPILPPPNNYANQDKLSNVNEVETEMEVTNSTDKISSRSSTLLNEGNGVENNPDDWLKVGQRRRSLYEEIVEEVLELTGKKLIREGKESNGMVPPKPPRSRNTLDMRNGSKKSIEVILPTNLNDAENDENKKIEENETEVNPTKVDFTSEAKIELKETVSDIKQERTNEKTVVPDINVKLENNQQELSNESLLGEVNSTSESKIASELKSDTESKNRMNIKEKGTLVKSEHKVEIDCETYESANESSYVTAESSENDATSLSSNDDNLSLKQTSPGSLCNMLEDNDDVFVDENQVRNSKILLVRVKSLPVNYKNQMVIHRKFSF